MKEKFQKFIFLKLKKLTEQNEEIKREKEKNIYDLNSNLKSKDLDIEQLNNQVNNLNEYVIKLTLNLKKITLN